MEYAGEMAAVLADPALHAFIGGEPLGEAAVRERYVRLTGGSPDPAVAWLNWVIRDRTDGRLVGTVQATVTAAGPSTDAEAEVAWVVGTPWQGRGFAAEAADELVRWLVDQGVGVVVAHVHPDHLASAAVAASAGLVRTERWHDGEVRWERSQPHSRPRASREPAES